MTPEEVVREVRRLRYSPNRTIRLSVLAHAAGVSERALYLIAERGLVSERLAHRLAKTLELLHSGSDSAAVPSQRRTPITEPIGHQIRGR